jgi:hypothetical protein
MSRLTTDAGQKLVVWQPPATADVHAVFLQRAIDRPTPSTARPSICSIHEIVKLHRAASRSIEATANLSLNTAHSVLHGYNKLSAAH